MVAKWHDRADGPTERNADEGRLVFRNGHPEIAPSGAGEPSIRPMAIANAVFDATGVRVRRVPLTPERMKAALS
jgi:CO/xanthine dehydrogenase Mo-binding subunit